MLEVSKNQEQSRHFAADMSNRLWAGTIADTFTALNDQEALRKMGLTDEMNVDSIKEFSTETCSIFTQLVLKTAAHRTWSMLAWEAPPEQWNGVLSSNEEDAGAAWKMIIKDSEVMAAARQGAQTPDHSELKDMGVGRLCPVQSFESAVLLTCLPRRGPADFLGEHLVRQADHGTGSS